MPVAKNVKSLANLQASKWLPAALSWGMAEDARLQREKQRILLLKAQQGYELQVDTGPPVPPLPQGNGLGMIWYKQWVWITAGEPWTTETQIF